MKKAFLCLIVSICFTILPTLGQTIPDPNLGLRADWLRGAVGMLWLPESNYNGNVEGIRIDPFLEQIDHLKTIDFIQIGLACPNIYSPVHTAPHPLLEMLWNKERDENGKPINLIVPREAVDDPFLTWLKAIKAKGLKTQVYVNSYNMLTRSTEPDVFPDISNRWMEYCDTNVAAQNFINSQPYYAAIDLSLIHI